MTTGSISGYVLDASGRAISGVVVLVSDTVRPLERQATTGVSGYYRIGELRPSTYRVWAKADRFQDALRADVSVQVNTNARVDFDLAIKGEKQSVEITARASLLQHESSELGTVLGNHQVSQLPLNRRDFLRLALLTPGVLPAVEQSELSSRGGIAIHANGGREEFNNFLLDGIDNNDQGVNRYVLQPPVDAVQEFKIVTNSYSAEYGRAMGAQINVITKSGTNDWHGFAYEYLRNRQLDTRNFFEGSEKRKYIRNQFGGGLGGPVLNNRTFIFASIDGLQERRAQSRLATVPTLKQRQGDLSELETSVSDPFTQQPFAGAIIPADRINPLAQRFLSLFPEPNLPGTSGNFLGQPVGREETWQGTGRLDHHLGRGDQITARYSYGGRDLLEPFAEESTDVPGYGNVVTDTGHNALLQWHAARGPMTINSLRVGLNRAIRRVLQQNYQTNVNQLWNVNYLPTSDLDLGYPAVTVAGFSRVGDPTQLPIYRPVTTYQVSDDLTFIKGAHTFKVGAEVRRLYLNGLLNLLSRGSMQFSGALSGSGLGDILLGFPSLAIQSSANNQQTLRSTSYNGYAQDNWRILPTLTLNLGLRYEYNAPYTDPYDRMSAFDATTGSVSQVGTNGITRSGYKPDTDNIAPRIGLAWSLSSNTVLRAGYGWFYDSGLGVVNSSMYFNPPFFNIRVFFPTQTALLTLQNPFPSNSGITPPASLSSVHPDLQSGVMQHWNLNVQREINRVGMATIAYTGSKGSHLIRSRDLNQPEPGSGALQNRRPYPAYGNIFEAESAGSSIYHGLLLSLNRPLSSGIAVLGSYGWSHSIDDTSAFLGTRPDPNFPQNSRNYRAERASSSFDVRHRATAAFTYQPQNRFWLWRDTELSGIVTVQSGQPLTPVLRFERSNTGNTGGTFGSDRPDVIGDPELARPTAERWFNTSAFALPSPFNFGNAGRNIIRGPGLATVDASVARTFPLGERFNITLQAQAFNLLNHTNFDNPERFADEPSSFGRIFSAKPARQIQLAVRVAF